MGYIIGAVKYILKSAFKNTRNMLIFGAGTLALIYLVRDTLRGEPAAGLTGYVVTKYLPPLTVEAFVMVLAVGCLWAGIKWYVLVPRP